MQTESCEGRLLSGIIFQRGGLSKRHPMIRENGFDGNERGKFLSNLNEVRLYDVVTSLTKHLEDFC